MIREELLDYLIMEELKSTKRLYQQNWTALQKLLDRWMSKQFQTTEQLKKLNTKIDVLEEETEAILMERIRDKANAERYDRMIQNGRKRSRRSKDKYPNLRIWTPH